MKKKNLKRILALLLVCVMSYGLLVHADGPTEYKLNFVWFEDGKAKIKTIEHVPANIKLVDSGVEIPPVSGTDQYGKVATSWWSSSENCPVDEDYEPHHDMNNISISAHHDHTDGPVSGAADATCTQEGSTGSINCLTCGDETSAAGVIPALGHDWSETYRSNADGHWHYCKRNNCVEKKDENVHDWDDNDECTVCGYAKCETHELVLVPREESTCTTIGHESYYKCENCEKCYADEDGKDNITDNMESINLPLAKHTEVTVSGTAAACEATGTTDSIECSECGVVISAAGVTPALGHDWSTEYSKDDKGHWYECKRENCDEKTTVASHTMKGEECSECGYRQCKSHELTQVAGEPSTCTTKGHEAYYKCESCKQCYKDAAGTKNITNNMDEISLPLAAHKKETIKGKAATCTETGLTDGSKCSVCNTELEKQETIPAKGHTGVQISGKSATCTETGLKDGSKCSVCNTILKEQETIPALGHDYVMKSNDKGHWKECQRAGCSEKTAVAAHIMENEVCKECGYRQCNSHSLIMVPAKPSTCAIAGHRAYYKCENCNQCYEDATGKINITNNMDSISLPLAAHTEVTVSGTAATCTDEGKTEGKKCSVCNTILKEQETIPAKGHTEETTISGKDATCTETGLTDEIKCSVCNTVLKEQEVIPMTAHAEETISGAAATCTLDGKTDGIKCTNCGQIIAEQNVIPALGHSYSDSWSNDANGHWHACNRCDSKIDESAHIPGAEATETEAQTCTICGYVINPQIGHTHELHLVKEVAAGCTEKGYKEHYECSGCSKLFADAKGQTEVTLEEITIPATSTDGAHTFGDWKVTKEATETQSGLRERICSGCGYVETEVIPALGSATKPPMDDNTTAEPPKDTNSANITNVTNASKSSVDSVSQQTNSDKSDKTAPAEAKKVRSPQTGDNQEIYVWIVLISVCGIMMLTCITKRKKANER